MYSINNIYGFQNVYIHSDSNIYESQYISKIIYIKNNISDSLNVSCGYLIRHVESIKISSQAQNRPNHVAIKSHYPKYPVNLYFRTIDIYFSIGDLSFRIDSVTFGQVGSNFWPRPLQWKYGTPPVEIWAAAKRGHAEGT